MRVRETNGMQVADSIFQIQNIGKYYKHKPFFILYEKGRS